MKITQMSAALLLSAILGTGVVASAQTTDSQGATGTQNGSQNTSAQNQTSPTTGSLNTVDKQYLVSIGRGSLYEQALSQAAVRQATNSQVKQYAQKLVDEHEQANQEFQQLAQAKGVTPPPSMDARSQTRLNRITRMQGAAFDRAYVREAIRINRTDMTKAQREAQVARDADVKQYAQKLASTDQEHLRDAQALPESTATTRRRTRRGGMGTGTSGNGANGTSGSGTTGSTSGNGSGTTGNGTNP